MFIFNIGTCDALLRCEGRHGVSTGQIDCDQFLCAIIEILLDVKFFFVYRNTCPVTNTFISACERIVHGGLTAVGIPRQCNSHFSVPPMSF